MNKQVCKISIHEMEKNVPVRKRVEGVFTLVDNTTWDISKVIAEYIKYATGDTEAEDFERSINTPQIVQQLKTITNHIEGASYFVQEIKETPINDLEVEYTIRVRKNDHV